MPKWWTFWAVIVVAVALAWLTSSPPAPKPATTPATEFSAARAMAVVRDIGRKPHPIGSVEHDRVRNAVAARLRALGLRTEILPGAAIRKGKDEWIGADVENVLGVLPGTDPSLPAVALMAHYDSVAGSPAAADDGAGVSSILEAVRAIKARGPARRDLVVLITDGEETGLFGATAFWRDNPLAKRIGSVVNLETRGSSGPAFMFETGPRNAGVVRLYGDRVARPESSSLNTWVYDHMPNGSDFTVPKTVGVAGVNIAMIGTPFDYHSPTSRPENLDQRSLQHMGDQTLAMADGLLRAEAEPARGEDLAFADLFGRVLVSYPAWAGWLLLGLAAVMIGFVARAGGLPERKLDIARGAGLFLFLIVVPAIFLHQAGKLVAAGPDFYQGRVAAQFGLAFVGHALIAGGAGLFALHLFSRTARGWAFAGVPLLVGAAGLIGFRDIPLTVLCVFAAVLAPLVLGRPKDSKATTLGLLVGALVVAIPLQAFAPQIAFLIAWPLLAAAAAALLCGLKRGSMMIWGLIGAVLAAVALGWTWRMAVPLFDGLGLANPELLGLFVALTGLVTVPFVVGWADHRIVYWTDLALSLAGVAVLAVVGLRDAASVRTPSPSHVWHVVNADIGEAKLVSAREDLDGWSRRALEAFGKPEHLYTNDLFLEDPWGVGIGKATPRFVPTFTATRQGDRVIVAIRDGGVARDLKLGLTFGGPITDVRINGQPAEDFAKPGEESRLRWYGARDGVTISFHSAEANEVRIRYAALADGWPTTARLLPPRPANVMATGSSDSSVVTGSTSLSW